MKRIDAIIKPDQLDSVKEKLSELGIRGLTVSEVRGFGRQSGHSELYRGTEYAVEFHPKIQVTVVAAEERVVGVIDAISDGARTGAIGDGKIFVSSIDEVVHIRTGERGPI